MKKNTTKIYHFLLKATPFFVFFIFLPLVAEGFALDPIKAGLTSMSAQTTPFFAIFAVCFLILLVGAAALAITSFLLQEVIELTPEALTVLSGDASLMIHGGWNFTAGIANMLLLISFIAIAIAVILGIESFGLKKALPQLIIVAFLMNFTLLFVGMGIDVSNFLFNSVSVHFAQDGTNMLLGAVEPVLNLTEQLIFSFFAFSAGMYALHASVIGAYAAHAFWATGVGLVALLPFVLQILTTGIIALALAGVFFIFFFVLIARIFIVQILAILAPIAFLCLIFPGTKKHWDTWLHHLVQWLFTGVALIFLMYIGLALAPLIEMMSDPLTEDMFFLFDWWIGGLLSPIILLIYFLVILGVVRKFVPDLANAAITSVKTGIKTLSPYAQTIGKEIKSDFFKQRRESLKKREAQDPSFSDMVKEGLQAQAPENTNRFMKPIADLNALRKRASTKARYSIPAQAGKEEKGEEAKKAENFGSEEMVNSFNSHIKNGDLAKALGVMSAANKKGINLSKELGGIKDNLYKQLKNEAKLIGAMKDLQKGAFVETLVDINSDTSLSEDERQANINNVVAKLDKDDIKSLSGALVSGSRSENEDTRKASRSALKSMVYDKNKLNPLIASGGRDVVKEYSSMIQEGNRSSSPAKRADARDMQENIEEKTKDNIGKVMLRRELSSIRREPNQNT